MDVLQLEPFAVQLPTRHVPVIKFVLCVSFALSSGHQCLLLTLNMREPNSTCVRNESRCLGVNCLCICQIQDIDKGYVNGETQSKGTVYRHSCELCTKETQPLALSSPNSMSDWNGLSCMLEEFENEALQTMSDSSK